MPSQKIAQPYVGRSHAPNIWITAVNRRKPALPFRANCVTTRLEHGEIEWEDADLKRVLDSATYH